MTWYLHTEQLQSGLHFGRMLEFVLMYRGQLLGRSMLVNRIQMSVQLGIDTPSK